MSRNVALATLGITLSLLSSPNLSAQQRDADRSQQLWDGLPTQLWDGLPTQLWGGLPTAPPDAWSGQETRPQQGLAQQRDAGQSPEDRLKQIDRNGDGEITADELPRPQLFGRLDRNSDGVITLDEVRQLRATPGPNDDSTDNMIVKRDIPYGEHEAQRLDVYAPNDAKRAPVMVYVHGGGWARGDKAAVGQKATFFTGEGWVFASINYRLAPDGKHPHNVEDVAQALAWMHDHADHYGGDPDAIFIMGHSAGCHLVSLVAADGRPLEKAGKSLELVKGVIALDTQAYDIPKLIAGPSSSSLYTTVFGEDPKSQCDASPIHHVARGKGIPPFLICYSSGMTARVNPYRSQQGDAFAAALKKAGVEADVVDASDRNHGQINQRFGDPNDEKVTGRAMAFLKALRQPESTPSPSQRKRPREPWAMSSG